MVKIVTLVGDDNQIYRALASKGKPVRILASSSASGPMIFTSLETEEGRSQEHDQG